VGWKERGAVKGSNVPREMIMTQNWNTSLLN